MAKKKDESGNFPIPAQQFYDQPGTELGATNAKPRDEEFDLVPSWKDEGTSRVVKKGNNPWKGF
jgi:hypothetical protein